MSKRRNTIMALILFAILLSTIFGEKGLIRAWHLRQEAQNIQLKADELKSENGKLRIEREALQKKDRCMIERLARQQLGLTMPNETVYLFPTHQIPDGSGTVQALPPTQDK